MGFDLSRFIGEVDEEFQCSICSMVLENPVQTPCDHLFCSECIEKWLSTNPSCPVDRITLANTDLEPINRSLRNLLSKIEIKCDFDSQGCNAVVKLECLQSHFASCEYNPFGASMQQPKQEISKLYERTEISSKPPIKWEFLENIKSPVNQPDVLETDNKSGPGVVRSFHALEPKNSTFKVQVLNGGSFAVGLSFKGESSTELGEWFAEYWSFYGSLNINGVEEYRGSKCKIGDIIELGTKLPLNFVNDGNASVELYLSINERVVKEKVIEMPMDGIYPTIRLYGGSATKIKYLGI